MFATLCVISVALCKDKNYATPETLDRSATCVLNRRTISISHINFNDKLIVVKTFLEIKILSLEIIYFLRLTERVIDIHNTCSS